MSNETIQDKIDALRRCISDKEQLQFELLSQVLIALEQSKQDAQRWNWIKENLKSGDYEWSITIPAMVGKFLHYNPQSAVDAMIQIESPVENQRF